jgi:hypothetical protein
MLWELRRFVCAARVGRAAEASLAAEVVCAAGGGREAGVVCAAGVWAFCGVRALCGGLGALLGPAIGPILALLPDRYTLSISVYCVHLKQRAR